jgi:Domain of unknown function (DUF4160)
MVVIHREHGMRFTIYVDDHEPAHVHVRGQGEARIMLGRDGEDPKLSRFRRMSDADVRRAFDVVRERNDEFLRAWRRIHG